MRININEFIVWVNGLEAPNKEANDGLIHWLKEWAKQTKRTEFDSKKDPFNFADLLSAVYPATEAAIQAYLFGTLIVTYWQVKYKKEETLHSGLQEMSLN